jgi:cytochrome b561
MERADTERYSGLQIALHWMIVALVVVQWLTHEAMEEFWDEVEHGEASGFPGDPVALIHAGSGASILLLMLFRLFVRLRHGAPKLPADMPPILKFAARANHYAFYALLIALPLSGASALLLGIEDAADLHSTLVPLLFLLIAAHLGGVVYHMAIRRDGILWRMLPGRTRTPAGG